MDPDLLSAENYYNEVFAASSPAEEEEARNQWLGGLLADRAPTRNPGRGGMPGTKKAGGATKKEASQNRSPDGSNGARQRGRPRLDTQDQTAAEVHSSDAKLQLNNKLTGASDGVRKSGWPSGRIDSGRRRPYRASTSESRNWNASSGI